MESIYAQIVRDNQNRDRAVFRTSMKAEIYLRRILNNKGYIVSNLMDENKFSELQYLTFHNNFKNI